MGLQEGYCRYACDVKDCGKAKYAIPGSTAAAEYTTRSYIDINGQTISQMLCKEHAAAYDAIVTQHDAEFAEFMKGGK